MSSKNSRGRHRSKRNPLSNALRISLSSKPADHRELRMIDTWEVKLSCRRWPQIGGLNSGLQRFTRVTIIFAAIILLARTPKVRKIESNSPHGLTWRIERESERERENEEINLGCESQQNRNWILVFSVSLQNWQTDRGAD